MQPEGLLIRVGRGCGCRGLRRVRGGSSRGGSGLSWRRGGSRARSGSGAGRRRSRRGRGARCLTALGTLRGDAPRGRRARLWRSRSAGSARRVRWLRGGDWRLRVRRRQGPRVGRIRRAAAGCAEHQCQANEQGGRRPKTTTLHRLRITRISCATARGKPRAHAFSLPGTGRCFRKNDSRAAAASKHG